MIPTTITLKIHNYDPESESLIVSFASDKTNFGPDEYTRFAYQPTVYQDPYNVNFVLKHIAHSGIEITEDIVKKEQYKENKQITEKYKELVGKQFTFSVKELYNFIHNQ
jgi:hypothetical protein